MEISLVVMTDHDIFWEKVVFHSNLIHTLRSLINVQSVINVQGDKFSKKNKRTGRKISSISVQG